MAETVPLHPPSLVRHLKRLHAETCPCEWAYKSLGRLYDVSMGKGWVRTTTHPECPHHGTKALKRHQAEQRRRERTSHAR